MLRGVAPVEVQRLTHEDIRSGRWRGETALVLAAAPPAAPAESVHRRAQPADAPAPSQCHARLTAPAAVPAPPACIGSRARAGVGTGDRRPAARASTVAAPGFWVQLGAFRQRQGAFELRELLMRELAWLEPWLAIFDDSALFRVQAGPFASRSEAQRHGRTHPRAATVLQPLVRAAALSQARSEATVFNLGCLRPSYSA